MSKDQWKEKIWKWAHEDSRLGRLPLIFIDALAEHIASAEAAQQSFAADETNRLRDLLWVGVLCGACGHSYKYNRADDAKGEKGHEEHLLAYPDCPSSRR